MTPSVVLDHIVFVFAGTSVQASPSGWKTHILIYS